MNFILNFSKGSSLATFALFAIFLTYSPLQAQLQSQLHCGSSNIPVTFSVNNSTCGGPLGIGVPNTGINGSPYQLTIRQDGNQAGGLHVENINAGMYAYAIYAKSANGVGLFSTTTGSSAKSVYAFSVAGSSVFAQTTSGNAIFGEATGTGLAGKFVGDVEISENLETKNFTVEAASTHNFGVAHFKAGANQQLFVVPNLGNGGFNHLSQSGDLGLFFSDGVASGGQNQDAGLVLGPWTGGYSKGLRINADGHVGIGTANPITALDINGSLHVEHNLFLGVDQPTATFHMQGDFKLANPVTEENEFEVNVDGEVKCRKVKVLTGVIADYVFEPDHQLPSLSEVESYIKEHKHLPGIKSQAAYNDIGTIDMGELQINMLEKVEELFLYTLQLEKRIKELEAKLDDNSGNSTPNE